MPKGLEHLGIPGPEYIRQELSACEDPAQWIETFQEENSVLLPSLRPALPFLDLHDVPRRDFHQSLIDVLKEQLKLRLKKMPSSANSSESKTTDGSQSTGAGTDTAPSVNDPIILSLVEKNFVLISFAPLQDLLFDALSRLPQIPEEILDKIEENDSIYKHPLCSLSVKRQIWQKNQNLFGEEISPLLSKYIKQKDIVMYSTDSQNSFVKSMPKVRRQGEIINKLAECIGGNIQLYDVILQFLRTLFLKTKNVHYCTLRTELLMKFHDEEKKLITNVDPCYRFTWCMDACLKEKEVDAKRAKEMQNFVHSLKKEQSRVLGDLSMIVCDPYTVNTLVHSIFKQLHVLSSRKNQLPKRNDECILLLRLLTLGISAWEIIDKQNFKEPKVDSKLLSNFCPSLMCMMVDDCITPVEVSIERMNKIIDPVNAIKNTNNQSESNNSVSTPENSSGARKGTSTSYSELSHVYDEEIPAAFIEGIENSQIASLLAAAYLNHLAVSKNRKGLQRVLETVLSSHSDLLYQDMFLHQFIFSLATMAEEIGKCAEFRNLIFVEYLQKKCKKETVLRHCYRLLVMIKDKIPKDVFQDILAKFEINENSSEITQELYCKL